jgi:hypothetical protein
MELKKDEDLVFEKLDPWQKATWMMLEKMIKKEAEKQTSQ